MTTGLDEEARRVLDLARNGDEPGSQHKARGRRRLAAALAGGSAVAGSVHAGAAAAQASSTAAGAGASSNAAAAAGLSVGASSAGVKGLATLAGLGWTKIGAAVVVAAVGIGGSVALVPAMHGAGDERQRAPTVARAVEGSATPGPTGRPRSRADRTEAAAGAGEATAERPDRGANGATAARHDEAPARAAGPRPQTTSSPTTATSPGRSRRAVPNASSAASTAAVKGAAAPRADRPQAAHESALPAGDDSTPPTLRQEVTLLRDAERARREGAHERALQLLDEHAEQFPSGTMATERRALRARILCALGRDAEAREVLEGVEPAHRATPAVRRARRDCS